MAAVTTSQVRTEIACEEEARTYDYEAMVAEMRENCGVGSERNPIWMVEEHKWRWDFQRNAVPRLVRRSPTNNS